jgi:hypothetical protein
MDVCLVCPLLYGCDWHVNVLWFFVDMSTRRCLTKILWCNEEPAKLTATCRCERCARILYLLRQISVNSIILVGFYQNLYIPSCINRKVLKNLQDGRHRQCFLLDKSCRKLYTIFSAVLYVNRGNVTSWRLLGYVMKQVPHWIHWMIVLNNYSLFSSN